MNKKATTKRAKKAGTRGRKAAPRRKNLFGFGDPEARAEKKEKRKRIRKASGRAKAASLRAKALRLQARALKAEKNPVRKANLFGWLKRSDFRALTRELKLAPKNKSLQREVIRAGEQEGKTQAQIRTAFRRAKVSTFDTREALRGYEKKKLKKFKAKKARKAVKKSSKAPSRSSLREEGKRIIAERKSTAQAAAIEKQLAAMSPAMRAQTEAKMRASNPKRKNSAKGKKGNAKGGRLRKGVPLGSGGYGQPDAVIATAKKGGKIVWRKKFPDADSAWQALRKYQMDHLGEFITGTATPYSTRERMRAHDVREKRQKDLLRKKPNSPKRRNGVAGEPPSREPIIEIQYYPSKGKYKIISVRRGEMPSKVWYDSHGEAVAAVEKASRRSSNPPKRRNGESAADRKRREFIGRKTAKRPTMLAANGTPKKLAALGKLTCLQLRGHSPLNFNEKEAPMLAVNPAGDHLYIIGGKGKFAKGVSGKIEKIGYLARKTHIGNGGTFDYRHRFETAPNFSVDAEGFGRISKSGYIVTSAGIEG